ncbi:hypothetical protein MATL_G00081640 [Megalops atlanticus]|uniref:IRS-type PTB domain-containing protein n=1 Tax=Megalops atlanticus TaxID=7932 RepID=A0A9D3Q6H7_MEGAT|nr:hypothetical protein MATL_G00081640 [Megalops atlanticus]
MEEDIRKRGMLYMQQQKFGKKWKKVWSLVYGDSNCSVSRMELFECKDDADRSRSEWSRTKRESRRVIRVSDFVRVSEEKVGACPRDCGAFLVETTEKRFLFAVETSELDDWVRTLCEIAFPVNRGRSNANSSAESGMVDNSLYMSSTALKDFAVTVSTTEASERCGLQGDYILRVDYDSIRLRDPESGAVIFSWSYSCLRKFGLHMWALSFEAGRRSESGEGVFMFKTKQNESILRAIDAAIAFQSKVAAPTPCPVALGGDELYSRVNKVPRPRPPAEPPVDALLAGVESLVLDSRVPPGKEWVRGVASRPLPTPEGPPFSLMPGPAPKGRGSPDGGPVSATTQYAVAGPPLVSAVSAREGQEPELSHPLYDSVSELGAGLGRSDRLTQPEPIYDKVEGRETAEKWQSVSLYDDVNEIRGHKWMLGTAVDTDEGVTDLSAPGQWQETPPGLHYDYSEENPYDNDIPKMSQRGSR